MASIEETQRHLKELAAGLSPSQREEWFCLSIHDLQLKSKVLLSCEKELGRSVASTHLGSLQTLGDLWNYFSQQPLQQQQQRQWKEEEIFPALMEKELPANLSVPFPCNRTRLPRRRHPFQNYHDPRHAQIRYPIKERRRRKQ